MKFFEFFSKYWLPIFLTCLALALCVTGVGAAAGVPLLFFIPAVVGLGFVGFSAVLSRLFFPHYLKTKLAACEAKLSMLQMKELLLEPKQPRPDVDRKQEKAEANQRHVSPSEQTLLSEHERLSAMLSNHIWSKPTKPRENTTESTYSESPSRSFGGA